jgi:hypothetical protein
MKKIIHKYARPGFAVITGLAICLSPSARAGWTGSMNGVGFGKAVINVTSSTRNSNSVATATMNNPSAAMTNTPGYVYGGPLPKGASPLTVARIKGMSGYVWQATTTSTNGDSTDQSELAPYVTPTASAATTTLEVIYYTLYDFGQTYYEIDWHWTGSGPGTAQAIKFYEYDSPLPADFNGDVGSLPGAVLLAGPFLKYLNYCPDYPNCICITTNYGEGGDYITTNPCPVDFDEFEYAFFPGPSDPSKVYMVTEGIAVSLPPCGTAGGLISTISSLMSLKAKDQAELLKKAGKNVQNHMDEAAKALSQGHTNDYVHQLGDTIHSVQDLLHEVAEDLKNGKISVTDASLVFSCATTFINSLMPAVGIPNLTVQPCIDAVYVLNLNAQTTKDLVNKLNDAAKALADSQKKFAQGFDHFDAAESSLAEVVQKLGQDFANQVSQALKKGLITPANAAALNACAQGVVNQILNQ